MKEKKQILTMECINSGYYKLIGGDIFCLLKGEYKEMKLRPLPSGYVQVVISNHKRGENHIKLRVYKHILVYMFTYGTYPQGWEIDHVDRDKGNTLPNNLRAIPPVYNAKNREERNSGYCERPIRGLEIDLIKTLMKAGRNQSEIARELNLNRLSVRYTMKNIEAGNKLKYEGYYA